MIDFDKIDNVEIGGLDFEDYPDFVNAYIESCDIDGVEATEEKLNEINDNSDFVYEQVINYIY